MKVGDLFRRALGRLSRVRTAHPEAEQRPGDGPPSMGREQAAAWLAAFEAGRLNPPRDVHDVRAWDNYWNNQIEVGAIDQGFADMMSSDPALVGLLTRRGSETILCAGNGLSTEALSLALHGFQVTALDISGVPAQVFGRMLRNPKFPAHGIPGFGIGEDNRVTVACTGPIDPDLCPAIHRSADQPAKGGGSLAFVTGDLMDPNVCPGPFHAVVERRTLQLFPEHERASAVDGLIARLAERSVFVSHEHRGAWRPGQPRTHYAEAWLKSRGFVLRSEVEGEQRDSAPRLASLMFSTG